MRTRSGVKRKDLDQTLIGIELILSDVDGVLTPADIIYDNQGIETKRFHVRDGLGIKLWQRAGFKFGIVTARNSHVVKLRAAELKVDMVRQGVEEKLAAATEIAETAGVPFEKVAYIGDDLPDLAVMTKVGVSVAVADASSEVAARAQLITETPGGHGAVRELIEIILQKKNVWSDLVERYL
jgi:3-deoxy-D-manno-octulosonate 8-phosphate phosphatase (KDO 8-P phosphatase)